MIYLDTSAMVKLIVAETESNALRDWLTAHSDENLVTSALGRIELMRTAARSELLGATNRARRLLDVLDIMPISDDVVTLAERVGSNALRSLDAIHLASASLIARELTAVVAYDRRLLDGCDALGLPNASPRPPL